MGFLGWVFYANPDFEIQIFMLIKLESAMQKIWNRIRNPNPPIYKIWNFDTKKICKRITPRISAGFRVIIYLCLNCELQIVDDTGIQTLCTFFSKSYHLIVFLYALTCPIYALLICNSYIYYLNFYLDSTSSMVCLELSGKKWKTAICQRIRVRLFIVYILKSEAVATFRVCLNVHL